ncbi:MAG TPA: MFS transporter, partial [Dissulfuribacter thermophilus]|nr:MFS transporter [Dissulfuribacter thermophilus]
MRLGLSRSISSLAHPGFRWLLLGQALSLQGTWIQSTAQRWLVLDISNSPFYVGVLGAVAGLPVLLFSFFGGYLSDRFNRFSVLFFAHSLIFLQGAFLTTVIAIGHIDLLTLIGTSFFLGTGMAFEVPARQGLVFDLVGREDITNALALHSTAFNLARFIGPAIAGYLMAIGWLAACFAIKALTALLVMGALIIILKKGYARPKGHSPSKRPGMKMGISFVRSHRVVRSVLLVIFVFGIVLLPYSVLLPSLGRDVLGLGAKEYGLLCSSNGFGALTGAIFVAILGHRGKRIDWWWIGALAFPLALGCVGIASGYLQAAIGLYISGFFMVICATSAISLIQIHAPDELRGQLMGLFTTSFMGFFPLGSLAIGGLASLIG